FGCEEIHQPVDDAVPEAVQDDTGDDDEDQAALEQRGQRMQAVPLAVGQRLLADRRRGERLLGRAHRPVRRVSATSMSVSRSASAAGWVSPGICTPVGAAAVTIFSCATPNARSSGPCVMSTSCMRPYGTATTRCHRMPLRKTMSSERSM